MIVPPAQAAVAAATPAALPAAPPPPPEQDVAVFEAALTAPRLDLQGVVEAPPLVEPAIVTPGTLGERILASVEQMRVGYKEGMTRIDATMDKPEVGSMDMMRLMVDAMRMSVQQEMLAKMVGRSVQNLDQLLKGQ